MRGSSSTVEAAQFATNQTMYNTSLNRQTLAMQGLQLRKAFLHVGLEYCRGQGAHHITTLVWVSVTVALSTALIPSFQRVSTVCSTTNIPEHRQGSRTPDMLISTSPGRHVPNLCKSGDVAPLRLYQHYPALFWLMLARCG
jgi:hypothetical protein